MTICSLWLSSCSSTPNYYTEKEIPYPDLETYNWLLESYVSDSGKVNYQLLLVDQKVLTKALSDLSTEKPSSLWTKDQKKAYWINLYNLFTLKLITDNYPLKSIKDLGPTFSIPLVHTVWSRKDFELAGKKISLDIIEHEILRKEFTDPRIHFAVNCASVSCPKLLNEAYNPKRIEKQLEDETRFFINNPHKNIIAQDEIWLSPIFKWYHMDFESHGGLKNFIAQYSKVPIDKELNVEYLEYNWNLNE